MKKSFVVSSLFMACFASSSIASTSELERLRALCAEQEMQIRILEEKVTQLNHKPATAKQAASTHSTAAKTVDESSPKTQTYTVRAGDSLEKIARANSTTVAVLMKANGLNAKSMIHPGQKLNLPNSSAIAVPVAQATSPQTTLTHTVMKGDTLYQVAKKYDVSLAEISQQNPGVNSNNLKIGQVLKIKQREFKQAEEQPVASKPSLSMGGSTPILNVSAPAEKPRAVPKPVRIDAEITYSAFASKHNTTTTRLDELNGLQLDPSTVLAKGSELYIPVLP